MRQDPQLARDRSVHTFIHDRINLEYHIVPRIHSGARVLEQPEFKTLEEVNAYYGARREKRMREFEDFSLFIVAIIGGLPLLLVVAALLCP